jgi:hypothetical protein
MLLHADHSRLDAVGATGSRTRGLADVDVDDATIHLTRP